MIDFLFFSLRQTQYLIYARVKVIFSLVVYIYWTKHLPRVSCFINVYNDNNLKVISFIRYDNYGGSKSNLLYYICFISCDHLRTCLKVIPHVYCAFLCGYSMNRNWFSIVFIFTERIESLCIQKRKVKQHNKYRTSIIKTSLNLHVEFCAFISILNFMFSSWFLLHYFHLLSQTTYCQKIFL